MEDLVAHRPCGHEGVESLLWVKTDTGAYGSDHDGPLYDWITGKEHFLSQVKKFGTVIQAGGNCGMYARFYSNYFDNVVTFEPEPLNFYCLDRNCVGIKFEKHNAGLGDECAMLSMNTPYKHNVGMHTVKNEPGDTLIVTLDSMCFEACDLLHLDIEGYEPKALRGAKNLIETHWPVIILERGHGREVIEEMGYREFKSLPWDTIFVKE